MLQKKLLFLSLITIFLLALLHYFGIKLHWYFYYQWLDIVAHILGGLWVTFSALWIFLKMKRLENIQNHKLKLFLIMFFSVLVIGILWEYFEVTNGNVFMNMNGYWPDTLSDVLNGFIGGVLAYLYIIKNENSIYVLK